MTHDIHRIVEFTHVADFTLRLRFEDGTEQTINFEPVLHGELYGPLADPEVFCQVRLDDEVHTLVWPNGADICPGVLYHGRSPASLDGGHSVGTAKGRVSLPAPYRAWASRCRCRPARGEGANLR